MIGRYSYEMLVGFLEVAFLWTAFHSFNPFEQPCEFGRISDMLSE